MTAKGIDTAARQYDGGVVFRMPLEGGGSIPVRVSTEALDDCEQSSRAHTNYVTVFDRHRYAIERVARRLLAQSRREEDGSILVRTVDLNR